MMRNGTLSRDSTIQMESWFMRIRNPFMEIRPSPPIWPSLPKELENRSPQFPTPNTKELETT
ncbi:hypothetical protein L3Y34_002962 [Caenorhabditis briggsae]|uniref:Uncharacterized protein n=1 Tax=Caenorhabditis briggsae TaxID=6238 RepID=A0AAE9A7W3_CAEBR|nr:hypothetical protein L3Y34_002962 [Caenorhabditis briggsae]